MSEIEKATQNQSENKVWFKQRYGRTTASNLHNVVSRLKFEKEEPIKNLVKSILHPKPFQSFATRHGIATEPHAKKEITRLLKLQHNKITSHDVGTVISETLPFVSASPDLKVSFSCCGET